MGYTSLLHKGSRIILPFLMIPLISYLIFFFNAGIKKRSISNQERSGSIVKEADTRIDDFSLFQTREGKVELEIKAMQAELFEEEGRVLLRDLKITINRDNGMRVYLVGDNGSFNTVSKDFQINKVDKDINVNLGDDLTVVTESIRWINEKREIVSDSPVEIRGTGMVIKGNQLAVNLDSQQFEVSGDVKTYLDK